MVPFVGRLVIMGGWSREGEGRAEREIAVGALSEVSID